MYKLSSLLVLLVILKLCEGNDSKIDAEEFLNDEKLKKLSLREIGNFIRNFNEFQHYDLYGNVTNNDTCNRDLFSYQAALRTGDEWALKMLDASSKLPSGILQGNVIDLGMYDECVKIRATISSDVEIRGVHCMYSINLMRGNRALVPVELSICLPSTCDGLDLNKFIPAIGLPGTNFSLNVGQLSCAYVDEQAWDVESIIFLSLFVVLVAFIVACSFYDASFADDDNVNDKVVVFRKFSLQRNAAAILSTDARQNNLPIIHGLRVLSMAWVILGHESILSLWSPNVNKLDILEWMKSWSSLYIFTAPYAVDTFFTISGFLLSYLFLKQMQQQQNRKFNIFTYYAHRYIRLTPSVIVLLIFSIFFVPKIGSGANWNVLTDLLAGKCREKWWSLLLYVQNFVKKDNICLPHLWYLAVDMQLFWISPIVLYPLLKAPKIGIGIIALFVCVSLANTAYVIGINQYPIVSFTQLKNPMVILNAFQHVYEAPYFRVTPWLIGIFFGYEIVNKNRKLNKSILWTGWLLAAVCFLFCVIGTRYFMKPDYKYDVVMETLFVTISKPIWALGICWIIYAGLNRRAGIIRRVLSWKALLPLSRLSYCIYLVHFVIQVLHVASIRSPSYFADYYVWRSYFSDFVISVIVAFFFSLLFESPILVLEKIIFKKS